MKQTCPSRHPDPSLEKLQVGGIFNYVCLVGSNSIVHIMGCARQGGGRRGEDKSGFQDIVISCAENLDEYTTSPLFYPPCV